MGRVDGGWGGWGWVVGVSGNFREFSRKFPRVFGDYRKLQRDIVQRQNKISTHGLYQNDSTIMTDSPVEYLRKTIFDAITEEFPTPFTYKRTSIRINHLRAHDIPLDFILDNIVDLVTFHSNKYLMVEGVKIGSGN